MIVVQFFNVKQLHSLVNLNRLCELRAQLLTYTGASWAYLVGSK